MAINRLTDLVALLTQSSVTRLRDLTGIYGYLKKKTGRNRNFIKKIEREKCRMH